MLPSRDIDQETLQRLRQLVQENFAARDGLDAAAAELDDDTLTAICRRLAEELGGNAANLQQLLVISGGEPAKPNVVASHLQGTVIELLKERHGEAGVLEQVEATEQSLGESYDAAIEITSNREIEGLLKGHRQDISLGEAIVSKLRAAEESSPVAT